MIGNYIRARRETLGMTQEELAAKAGIYRQDIYRLESGASYRHLDAVAKVMGIKGIHWKEAKKKR